MVYQVSLAFGQGREVSFEVADAELRNGSVEEARRWFDKEFADLRCEVANPVGKVLIIDKILNVARCGGERRFAEGTPWAKTFARNAALVLGRETIRLDLDAFVITY